MAAAVLARAAMHTRSNERARARERSRRIRCIPPRNRRTPRPGELFVPRYISDRARARQSAVARCVNPSAAPLFVGPRELMHPGLSTEVSGRKGNRSAAGGTRKDFVEITAGECGVKIPLASRCYLLLQCLANCFYNSV